MDSSRLTPHTRHPRALSVIPAHGESILIIDLDHAWIPACAGIAFLTPWGCEAQIPHPPCGHLLPVGEGLKSEALSLGRGSAQRG